MGVLCVTFSVMFTILSIASIWVIPVLTFRRNPTLRDEYSLTFSRDGIHFRTPKIDSQLHWSLYPKALVDAHAYLLYYGTRQFTVIPKRVFESVDDQRAFEQLLTEHVARIVWHDT